MRERVAEGFQIRLNEDRNSLPLGVIGEEDVREKKVIMEVSRSCDPSAQRQRDKPLIKAILVNDKKGIYESRSPSNINENLRQLINH